MRRSDIQFDSGDATCAAWLYLPDAEADAPPPPVVVMGHGLGAVREMRLDAYAERFAAAGYACLVFDYRHFGASGGEPRQLLDVRRQLEDWRSAIACARGLAEVDGDRVALWGSSFGGGHVLATAAREPGVAAVVAQCPFTDGLASASKIDVRSVLKVTARASADALGALLRRPPRMVGLGGPPHSAALMTAPDVVAGFERIVPAGSSFRNEVAARVGFQILRYRPGRDAARIACPLLMCLCEQDTVAPAATAERYARQAPRAEVRRYPIGHFDIYMEEAFEQAVADQLAFLRRVVPPDGARG